MAVHIVTYGFNGKRGFFWPRLAAWRRARLECPPTRSPEASLSQIPTGYHEHRPIPALAGLVDRIWTVSAHATAAAPHEHRVLPDGRMDLVFQLGAQPGRGARGGPAAYVVGSMLAPADIRYEGPACAIGVRFHPGAARAWVDAPAHALVDAVIDLGDVWRGVPSLIDALGSAPDEASRVAILERQLVARRRDGFTADAAAVALERSGGKLGVADLSRLTGAGERMLQRRFRDAVGYPPRTARRVARFIRASAILSRAPDTPWPEVVHACGYHDQPHLIREFRAFAGATPVEFAAARRVGSVQDERREDRHIPRSRQRRSA